MTSPVPPRPPEQLVLDLPHRPALGSEDFLVGRCNGSAVELIDRWPDWPSHAAAVIGPQSAGKSHLAHVWRLKSSADSVTAQAISERTIAEFEANPVLAIEDLDRGIGDDRILFHLLNLAREKRGSLLLTSRLPPGDLTVALPDLRSRLRALPLVSIDAPDDDVLKVVLVKLFADRQLTVEPHVIGHLALHMERSFEAARSLVEACDRLALSQQRRVTRALAGQALAAAGVAGQDFDSVE